MNDRIHVIYGDQPKEMVHIALDHLNLADRIDPSMVIGLKPNLVVAKPSNSGATTSAQIVEGVIEYLFQNHIRNIWIMESSGVGHSTKKAFKATGLDSISKRYGNRLRLIDLKDEPVETVKSGRFKTRIFGILNRVRLALTPPVLSPSSLRCRSIDVLGLRPMILAASNHQTLAAAGHSVVDDPTSTQSPMARPVVSVIGTLVTVEPPMVPVVSDVSDVLAAAHVGLPSRMLTWLGALKWQSRMRSVPVNGASDVPM